MAWLAILFSFILLIESFWLFAWSAHVAPFLEKAAPAYLVVSLVILWTTYGRCRKKPPPTGRNVVILAGVLLFLFGALVGLVAVRLS